MHGLQLTINVEEYENVPFADQDSGIKASWSFAIYKYTVSRKKESTVFYV